MMENIKPFKITLIKTGALFLLLESFLKWTSNLFLFAVGEFATCQTLWNSISSKSSEIVPSVYPKMLGFFLRCQSNHLSHSYIVSFHSDSGRKYGWPYWYNILKKYTTLEYKSERKLINTIDELCSFHSPHYIPNVTRFASSSFLSLKWTNIRGRESSQVSNLLHQNRV